ncbi:SPOR domain-containing protein [Nannocystaceae bacterium ST9]
MRLAASLALLSTFALTLVPNTADACWDGIYAASEKTELRILEGDAWAANADLESAADWLTRIDALLPGDARLSVDMGYVDLTSESGTCSLIDPPEIGDFEQLFDLVAASCQRSKAEIASAREQSASLYTVQLLSTREREAAEALIEELETEGCSWHGFYEQGGFPSFNPCASIETATLADGREVHRVLVGNYLSRADAELDRRSIRADLGHEGMVRRR